MVVEAERIHVGLVGDYALNDFQIFQLPIGSIGVVRTETGFFAIRNACPHRGAPLCRGSSVSNSVLTGTPFELRRAHENLTVRCPWHRWEFRIDTGESIRNVTRRRVQTYPVEVDGNNVYIVRRTDRTTKMGRSEQAAT